MDIRSKGDFVIGWVVAALACVGIFWLIPTQTEASASGIYDLSPRLVPRLSLVLCLLLGLGLAARGWLAGRPGRSAAPHPMAGGDGPSASGLAFDMAVWVGTCIPVMLLLEHAGFIVTGTLLLAGWLYFAGARSLPVIAAVSLILPFALDRLCWYVLTVELP